MLLGLVFALSGLAVLTVAADHFVRGAARIAVAKHVSPVVVGAVLIGFGTSAPEMVVSGIAAGRGDLDIGVGNIVGSNVANISLVLAAAASIVAIPVSSSTIRREVPISVASVIVFALLIQGEITRLEGAFVGDGGSDELNGAREVGLLPIFITGMAPELSRNEVDRRKASAAHVINDLEELILHP